MTSEIFETAPDCEIMNIRDVQASRETVFEAWTNPNRLANWWGPKGFTNTFNEFDLRPGGKWKFIMHGPDKGNYLNECEFTKIIPMELIAWSRISNPKFQVVVTFEELSKDVTKVIYKMLFRTAEECNKVKGFAVEKNEENLDKLEDELKKMTSK